VELKVYEYSHFLKRCPAKNWQI